MEFFATHTDAATGTVTELVGESIQAISKEMAERGLDGTVKVTDEAGFVHGWASAQHWRVA